MINNNHLHKLSCSTSHTGVHVQVSPSQYDYMEFSATAFFHCIYADYSVHRTVHKSNKQWLTILFTGKADRNYTW